MAIFLLLGVCSPAAILNVLWFRLVGIPIVARGRHNVWWWFCAGHPGRFLHVHNWGRCPFSWTAFIFIIIIVIIHSKTDEENDNSKDNGQSSSCGDQGQRVVGLITDGVVDAEETSLVTYLADIEPDDSRYQQQASDQGEPCHIHVAPPVGATSPTVSLELVTTADRTEREEKSEAQEEDSENTKYDTANEVIAVTIAVEVVDISSTRAGLAHVEKSCCDCRNSCGVSRDFVPTGRGKPHQGQDKRNQQHEKYEPFRLLPSHGVPLSTIPL